MKKIRKPTIPAKLTIIKAGKIINPFMFSSTGMIVKNKETKKEGIKKRWLIVVKLIILES